MDIQEINVDALTRAAVLLVGPQGADLIKALYEAIDAAQFAAFTRGYDAGAAEAQEAYDTGHADGYETGYADGVEDELMAQLDDDEFDDLEARKNARIEGDEFYYGDTEDLALTLASKDLHG